MRRFNKFVIVALILPTAAIAQVGPNPAVSGGSLDPGVSASTGKDATVAGPAEPSVGVGTATWSDATTPTGDTAASPGTSTTVTDEMSDMHKSHGDTQNEKKR